MQDLDLIRKAFKISDAEFGIGTTAQVAAILTAAEGPSGPCKLLKAMRKEHVHIFLVEWWQQISEQNDPGASGYSTEYLQYDPHTCQLFILWAWSRLPTV